MNDPTEGFNKLVRQLLWPAFKALGYQKSGNNFRYYNPAGWGKIVQFQKSQWNSGDELKFTVNTGLYLAEVERYWCSRESGATFSESSCVVRQRLGELIGSQHDEWYTLTAAADPDPLFVQLVSNFQQVVQPYLATINSRADIYALLVAGHRSHYITAQIQALHQAGYQQTALDLWASEWASTANQFYRQTLRELAAALKLPLPA